MAINYSEVSVTSYNANPPDDDGTAASSNEIEWDKHKTKLGDPLKTAIETTQTNVTTVVNAITAELIEASTAMVFMQTAAPTGWTKDTTASLDDTALRLITGTVSNRTGQTAFSTLFSNTSTDGHTLSTGELSSHDHSNGNLSTNSNGNHTHSYSRAGGNASPGNSGTAVDCADRSSGTTGTDGSHSHNVSSGSTSNTGSNSSHSHGIDLRVNYLDVIKATKDSF